jgi:hypothetical protein
MMTTVIVALNSAMFLHYKDGTMQEERETLSVFVIVNILCFGLLVNRRRLRTAFFTGFEISGALVAVASLMACWFMPDAVETLFDTVVYPLVPLTLQRVTAHMPHWVRDDISASELYVTLPIYLLFGPIITSPIVFAQVLLALGGGHVFASVARWLRKGRTGI